jgi:hypothetical protein
VLPRATTSFLFSTLLGVLWVRTGRREALISWMDSFGKFPVLNPEVDEG